MWNGHASQGISLPLLYKNLLGLSCPQPSVSPVFAHGLVILPGSIAYMLKRKNISSTRMMPHRENRNKGDLKCWSQKCVWPPVHLCSSVSPWFSPFMLFHDVCLSVCLLCSLPPSCWATFSSGPCLFQLLEGLFRVFCPYLIVPRLASPFTQTYQTQGNF